MSTSKRTLDFLQSEQFRRLKEAHLAGGERRNSYIGLPPIDPEWVPVQLREAWRQWAGSRLGR